MQQEEIVWNNYICIKTTWFNNLKIFKLTLYNRELYFEYRKAIQDKYNIIRKIYLDSKTQNITFVYMPISNWNFLDRIAYFIDNKKITLEEAWKNNLVI